MLSCCCCHDDSYLRHFSFWSLKRNVTTFFFFFFPRWSMDVYRSCPSSLFVVLKGEMFFTKRMPYLSSWMAKSVAVAQSRFIEEKKRSVVILLDAAIHRSREWPHGPLFRPNSSTCLDDKNKMGISPMAIDQLDFREGKLEEKKTFKLCWWRFPSRWKRNGTKQNKKNLMKPSSWYSLRWMLQQQQVDRCQKIVKEQTSDSLAVVTFSQRRFGSPPILRLSNLRASWMKNSCFFFPPPSFFYFFFVLFSRTEWRSYLFMAAHLPRSIIINPLRNKMEVGGVREGGRLCISFTSNTETPSRLATVSSAFSLLAAGRDSLCRVALSRERTEALVLGKGEAASINPLWHQIWMKEEEVLLFSFVYLSSSSLHGLIYARVQIRAVFKQPTVLVQYLPTDSNARRMRRTVQTSRQLSLSLRRTKWTSSFLFSFLHFPFYYAPDSILKKASSRAKRHHL